MHSKLYKGFVEHERYHPRHHRLRYNLIVYAVDLGELKSLDRRLPLFGYNRPKPVTLHDEHYLDSASGSIREKLLKRVASHVPVNTIEHIFLVTSPRLLGHVFNPVNFYFCFDGQGGLSAAVAEVNNTFGEKHVYVLTTPIGQKRRFPIRFRADKAFHVSPFNNMDGTYEFRFGDIRRELDIQIDLHRDGAHVLKAHLVGKPQALTPFNHLKSVFQHPIMPHLTMLRIYWEALQLKFRRKLDFHSKPVPRSPMTIGRRPPTTLQRYCRKLVLDFLARARHGRLELTMPDGAKHDFGPSVNCRPARLRVNDYRFFSRVVLSADIGLGEAYMYDEWDTEDLPEVLRFFIRNRDTLKDGDFRAAVFSRVLEKLRFFSRANTLLGSRRNIHRHYDLSNEFFHTFLDESMAYSAAIFDRADDTLERAQQNKYRAIIAKARLTAEDHLLEIGCGWGGFAMEAVRQTGCRVTGITISEDQYRLARERIRRAGMEDNITILFRDYRRMRGRFDKIVSIEMLEAVGHAYYKNFFKQVDRLLAPQGIAVIQFISIPDQHYESYRKSHDWIQKHIFPGGLLPSLSVLIQTMTRHTRLMVEHVENIGNHYATTLAEWRRRFVSRRDQVSRLGFDRIFRRKWAYYLGSCEAGFRERVLGDLQVVITREGNLHLL